MYTYTKRSIQAAYDRSARIRGWERATQDGPNRWTVRGQHGTYAIRLQGRDWSCSCPAGLVGAFCWHLAASNVKRAMAESARAQAEREVAAVSAPASRRDGVLAPAGGGSRRPLYDAELDGACAFGGLGA